MKKTKTGIEGFDKLLKGGFLKGKSILLSGTPGTGKTIFALQFLYNGATKFREKGILVTFEEKANDLKNQAKQFGWDFSTLDKENKARIININPSDLNFQTLAGVIKLVQDTNVKRLVIDSLSTLSVNYPSISESTSAVNECQIKKFIYSFINELRALKDTTTLLISQNFSENALSGDNVSEFVCDGVIHMIYESMGGEFTRSLIIRKMRQTKNDEDVHPLEISSNGIIVHDIK